MPERNLVLWSRILGGGSLVCLLAVFTGHLGFYGLAVLLSIAGVVTGHKARSRIRRRNPAELAGSKLGVVLSYAGLTICVLLVLLIVLILVALAHSDPFTF